MPEFKSDGKHEALLAATQKTHELISKLTDQISGGFESMHSKLGSFNRGQSSENLVNQTNIQNNQNHVHSRNKSEHNYVDEYRSSLRSNSPLESLIGVSTKLKGNNIGSYL